MPTPSTPFISVVWATDAYGICTTVFEQNSELLPLLAGVHLPAWVASAHAIDGPGMATRVELALTQNETFRFELCIVCEDAAIRSVVITGMPRLRHDAVREGFTGSIVDVTEQREALEHALRSEAEHRLIVDNSTDLIAHCGPDGRYIHISSAYTKIMGWTPQEMVGQLVTDFLHPDDRAHAHAALLRVFNGLGSTDVVEVRKRDTTGRYVSLGTKACNVVDPVTGQSLGAVLVSRDITLEKEMLHRIERMAEQNVALIENSPDIMLLLDQRGMILHANDAVYSVLGYRSQELLGRPALAHIGSGDNAETAHNLMKLGLREGYLSWTVACQCKNGQIVQLAWSMRRPPGSDVIYATARDVTESHRTRLALQQTHEHVRTLLESIDDGFFSVNKNWEITYSNTLAAAFVGVDRDASVGKIIWDVAPDIAESSLAPVYRRAMAQRESTSFELLYEPTGVWLRGRVYARDDGLSVFFHDISERVESDKVIRESERRLSEMLSITPAGYVLTDAGGIVREVNPALCQLSGYSRGELIGSDIVSILIDGERSPALNVRQHEQQVHALETVIRHKHGQQVYALVNQTIEWGADGQPRSMTAFITDITERKHAEARLEQLATRDALTGLPNRAWINQRVQAMLKETRDNSHTTVLFIDLNRFKQVNDSMGHATGDRLLQQVGRRLQSCMRPGDVVARLGGDEFVVAANCSSCDAAAAIAERLLASLRTPFLVDGLEMGIGASIGISLSDAGTATQELLFQNADTAMYKAKACGDGAYQFFEPEMSVAAKRRLQLEMAMQRALEYGQFELHYQPRVDLQTLRVRGMEALLRWNHPDLGQIAPLEFIPIAEERGHIESIGQWVLREACRWSKHLNDKHGLALRVSVNVSARQLRSPDLVLQVAQALQESGLPAAALELELTESALIDDIEQSADLLCRLKQLGITLSLDDFGTGYSSLSYLKRFPVDVLKLDRSFVNQHPLSVSNVRFLQALVAMAHALDLSVVAEGIETQQVMEALRGSACDEGQGYLFARPMPLLDFERFLQLQLLENVNT
jgi:diguanylate cyclase (GGDEF)-like protein/PAS domain S-box-containing protein